MNDFSTPEAIPDPSTLPPEMLITDSVPASGASDKAALRILLRDGSIIERELTSSETKIGKGPQNDIILADPAVSTAHAVIHRNAQGYTLSDVGSRNGTFVNEQRISEPRQLAHGDIIKMGRCTLTFRSAQASNTVILERAPVPAAAHHHAQQVTEETLAAALVATGLANQAQIDRLRGPEAKGRRLFRALLEEKLISDTDLRDLISSRFAIPIVDLSALKVDTTMANTLTAQFMREHFILPASGRADLLPLVVADPSDEAAIERAKKASRKPVELRLAAASEIAGQIDQLFAPRLVGVLPSGEKLEALITQQELEIGKAPHNQIVLNYPTVSNTHAVILARDGGYSIIDFGSSNGTFVNGQRLGDAAHTLQHGDKIQIAEVLLTYRNPGETVENKTARLSPEILEEVRRRAGLTSQAFPAAAGAGVAAGAAASAFAGQAQDSQGGEKKKKKDKKKDDDRMKAALLNSASRLLATLLGSILTVVVAVYGVRMSFQQSPNQGGGGGSSSGNGNMKLSEPGSFLPLSGGKFEASGAVWIPDTNLALLVDDGKPGQILLFTLDEAGRQAGAITTLNLGAQVLDPEAITYDGTAWFYVVSSHTDPNLSAQYGLLRFAFDRDSRTVRGTPEVVADLRGHLLELLPELRAEGEKPGAKGGLNIEGLTWDPINGRLLVGLRSPLMGGRAVIVPLRLKDPLAPLTRENLVLDNQRTIQFNLGGQGIRDLDYNPQLKSFLIISGATEVSEKTDFGLWEWNGDADQSKAEAQPRREALLDERAKPEGITNVTINGKNFLLIVGDDSKYLKLDYK